MRRIAGWVGLALAACGAKKASESVEAVQEPWEVGADGITLEGTLRLPERTGPVPAVVLVHGSGPHSRAQPLSAQLNMAFGVEVRSFRDLAVGLRDRGVGSFAYDKRSCGPFNGCADNGYPLPPADLTLDVFVADAVAVCEALGAREEVSEVWIVGHSQGGQMVPAIVQACGAAGGVMLAAPHDPVDVLIRGQLEDSRALLEDLGQDEAAIDAALASLVEVVEGIEAIRAGAWDGGLVGGATPEFWQSWIDLGDAAPTVAAGLSVPLMAAAGDYDWNVPPAQLEAWSRVFEGASARRETVLWPCVSHALNCLEAPDFRDLTPETIGERVEEKVVEDVAAAILR